MPPRLARLLLLMVVDSSDSPFLIADLAEEYEVVLSRSGQSAASRWYWSQTLRSILPSLSRTLRKRFFAHRESRTGLTIGDKKEKESIMNLILQDIRYALRSLTQKPFFAGLVIVTLALGIGANTAIFSIINSVLLRPLPYEKPEQLMALWETNKKGAEITVSYPNFADWQQQSRSFESMTLYNGWGPVTARIANTTDRVEVALVTKDFFTTLRVKPYIDRTMLPEEHRPGASPTAVVSYGFWQRHFNGDRNLTNKNVSVAVSEDTGFAIVGVMPPDFSYPNRTDIWIPAESFIGNQRSARGYRVIGRLKEDANLKQAQAEMEGIGHSLAAQYPDSNRELTVTVKPLLDNLVGPARQALWILFAAVGFVLLIACANVSNLFLSRSLARQKEFAIRTALGASRLRLAGQLLTESLIFALFGAGLGLLLASQLIRVLVSFIPTNIPRIDEAEIDLPTLGFTITLSLVTCVLFGLIPALRGSRSNVQDSLKEGGRGAGLGRGSNRALNVLVATEIAFSILLLIGSGLLIKSYWTLQQVKLGFNAENVLTFDMELPPDYKSSAQKITFYQRLTERLQNLPGVASVGLVNSLPVSGDYLDGAIYVEGQQGKDDYANYRVVSPDYFETMKIPLIKGRLLARSDQGNTMPVTVVNQTLVDRFFDGQDPIGRRMTSGGMDMHGDILVTIVGVVGDIRHRGQESAVMPEYYLPYTQRPDRVNSMTATIRTRIDPASLIPAVREEVSSLDKTIPIEFALMTDVVASSTADRRYNMFLLVAFAGLALFLSISGIYGVLSYAVTQRTRDIGIRLALGAAPGAVIGLIIKQGFKITLAGVTAGIGLALILTRLMAGLLFNVSPLDATVFVGIGLVTICVTLLASYIPARRATKIDPMIALRFDG